ncbi:hypothetical protein BS47DRAFT_1394614 [Hydnum rufescens UP504]|uniref:Uncharacterized protein n=1 Tax=Hydnum rufescens UP504 TaxID=1448309 RepID=A0A9P6DUR3_9AGAM|nr:hypothetical protein BS47DRAFT_1394614 [Hydnum rufescens UP504]
MTALLSEKTLLKQEESNFCWGLLRKISSRRGRSASINSVRPVLNVDTVLDDDHSQTLPTPPPPPYRNSPPSPSLPTLVSDAHDALNASAAARETDPRSRRPRRLSKPRPGVDTRNSVASFFTSSPARSTKARNSTNLDSSGRLRPPVSGTKPTSPHARPPSSANAHDYHYKRTRRESANSTSRTREAILCLQAVLDACEAGAVKDLRHVIEQVVLARNILVGEESPTTVDLTKFGVHPDRGSGGNTRPGDAVDGVPSVAATAGSVTALIATLPPPNSRASMSMPALVLTPPPPLRVSVNV